MTVRNFPSASLAVGIRTIEQLVSKFNDSVRSINSAMAGKINAVSDPELPFTLTAGATTTVLTDDRLGINSVVTFDPLTANAATELAAGTMYALAANRNNGAWTVTHANAGSSDRTFRYLIIG